MNLAFIGYRSSGKTTVSNKLSKLICWEKIEIDKEIEKFFKMKIPQIINYYGWDEFRLCEASLIKKYSQRNDLILDLGGGAILNEENMACVKKNSIVIFLNCSPAILIERLKNSTNRPPLTNLNLCEEVITTLNDRMFLYKKYSDYIIDTGCQSIQASIYQVYNILLNYLEPLKINKISNYFINNYSYV
jgi:shikimate kinase